jgi:hypothetical protein
MPLTLQVNGAINFRQLDPARGTAVAGKYFVRHAGCGPLTIEARGAHGRSNWSANLVGGQPDPRLGTATNDRFTIPRPAGGCAIQVSCQAGNEFDQVEIWYVACSLVPFRAGSPGAGDPNWPRVQGYLRQQYVGGQSYTFPELGRIRFPFSDSAGSGVRYGEFTKLVATITPANTPIGFFHARRFRSVSVSGFDAQNRPLPTGRGPRVPARSAGDNDTSESFSAALTPAGQIFDYDLPGATMGPQNQSGDRHVWAVTFEQAVGIGATTRATAWSDLSTNARLLASIEWSANYTARYGSAAGTMFGEVTVTGN